MTTQPPPPLAGIRIVAVEQYGAGPYATLYLADMGADVVKKEKFFQMLVQAIDLPELATDPRFASFAARREHRVTLVSILSQRFKQHTTASWMQRLCGRVPCAPVRSLSGALDGDELTERHMLASYQHPAFGQVGAIGTPFTLGGFQPEYRAGPRLNGDQRAILADLGYDAAAIAYLAAEGAFGNQPVAAS